MTKKMALSRNTDVSGEVEGLPSVASERLADPLDACGGEIINEGVDDFAGMDMRFNGIEKAANLLMVTALHVATDERSSSTLWAANKVASAAAP